MELLFSLKFYLWILLVDLFLMIILECRLLLYFISLLFSILNRLFN